MAYEASIDTLPSMSQTQDSDIQILNAPPTPKGRNKHLSLVSMRGVCPLFRHYFNVFDAHGRRKRLSKKDKNQRWKNYKQRMYRDYGRVITGTFSSEQALVKRYSNPLSFLKYKLKKTKNLNVTDLSLENQEYYREIGGLDDVEQLIRNQRKVDFADQQTHNIRAFLLRKHQLKKRYKKKRK
eukprot:912018_1